MSKMAHEWLHNYDIGTIPSLTESYDAGYLAALEKIEAEAKKRRNVHREILRKYRSRNVIDQNRIIYWKGIIKEDEHILSFLQSEREALK